MTKASDNDFPSILVTEQGSAPTTPAASHQRIYIRTSDHKLVTVNSSGTVTAVGGSGSGVATDAIWTTSGKVAVATGTATATEQWPPGHEFDYVSKTSDTSVTATTEATANTVITGNAVTYDGSTVIIIELFSADVEADPTAGRFMQVWLYDGSTSLGTYILVMSAAANDRKPLSFKWRLTPSNASHTYSVRASVNAGTGQFRAGAGGAAASSPLWMRIIKV
jgi:hypothetical protein